MPTQLLVNVLSVTLAPFETQIIPHGLKSSGRGLVPSQVYPDRPTPIATGTLTDTTVTFTNTAGVPQVAVFRVEHDHSIHADGATPTYWRGFTSPGGVNQATYGSFSSSVDQPLAAGVANIVTFDTVEAANGVSLVAGTKLTVTTSGVYAITVSPQLLHSGGGTELISFWLKLNGATVPRSASSLEMGNNNNRTLPFIEIILPMNAGQWIEWAFTASTGTNITLEHFPANGVVPAIPSVIASVKRLGDLP